MEPCGTAYLIMVQELSTLFTLVLCVLSEKQLKMKQNDDWSKPYAASFAINKLYLRQPNTFYKSVGSIPPTPLLSKLYFSMLLS